MATKKEKITKSSFKEKLLKSAEQAVSITKGNFDYREKYVSLIEEPPIYSKTKIKKIRKILGLSQPEFARIFGETTSAVKQWEQGNRNMSKSASRLLSLLESNPELVLGLIADKEKKKVG